MAFESLKDLMGYSCDAQNAYSQAPYSRNNYVVCGSEFGLENFGKHSIIVCALYGRKSSGADYWRHVRSSMEEIELSSCKADPDFWLRPALKSNRVE